MSDVNLREIVVTHGNYWFFPFFGGALRAAASLIP